MKNKTILLGIIMAITILVGVSIVYCVFSSMSFTRKKECGKLQAQIEAYIIKNGPDDGTDTQVYAGLDKVFYSPKLNSCMYTMTTSVSQSYSKEKGSVSVNDYILVDALTNERIASIRGGYPEVEGLKSYIQAQIEFNEIVNKYR